ncbi:long-chain fatty acid CoA synthetase [Bermanella marisrubri]|uniref:Probable AMP-binding enzyme n=1 Tax=Bermanella marisrubri TaxID=207949 RepID=Q1N5D2_9GAMM|nr:long-chain fatty acid CoA synthetase [Bermanella marisrubri]EAT13170.1 probable AMP-binding enzyme [Oceanobacter sp. RED65] [Bermanella marisrubri]QIZ83942.1 long-chain fatty acid CoA synthetase [Bermanella marisrubri]
MLTPLAAFYAAVKEQPNKAYLRQPKNGVFKEYTWADVERRARNIAFQLRKLGIEKNDKVALWSKNCAEWIITDIAIMMAGAVSVPLYPGQSKKNVRFVLEHSEAKVMFVGKHDNDQDVIDSIPENFPTVGFHGYTGPTHYDFDQLVNVPAAQDFKVNEPSLEDIMTIVYTSGTTGQPKGTVHNYHAYAFAASNAVEIIGLGTNDRGISFLPLAHVAERVIVEGQSYYGWFSISFVESLDSFQRDLTSIRPTLFFAVPRLWSKFQEGILAKLGGMKKFNKLIKIPLLGSLLKWKIRRGLGLDQARLCGCGASPMPKALIEWFDEIGIPIVEGYGMTENMAYGTFNFPDDRNVGSVGKPFAHVDVKISEQGEILFKSEALMLGYYKDEEKTKEALAGGYYHTGDKGHIDDLGFLHITGRVKELFKTSKGKYVAPAPIEGLLSAHPHIEQVCVMGSGRNQPIAVVELSETARGLDKEALEEELIQHLGKVNQDLEHHERVECLVLTQETWTVESGLITPTLKIRRDTVEDRFYQYVDGTVSWAPAPEANTSSQVA